MSPSARRLTGPVRVDRFQWQTRGPAAAVSPLLPPSDPAPIGIAPAMRDLPSPAAERLQTVEREAYDKGYAAGERAGADAATARLDPVVARLTATIEQIAALRPGVMRRSERELVRLALAIAERVLHRELDIDQELLAVMARVAIERLGEHAVATIHLNPVDCEAVLSRRGDPQPGAVEIVADANVPRGGCLVRSAFGSIDAGIDAQMRELSRALLGDGEDEEPFHDLAAGA